MADFTLQYVHTFIDARDKLRHEFRRKGHKRKTIKGRPGSFEFMEAYHALIEKTGGEPVEIGAGHTKAGTIDALMVAYFKHDVFKKGLAKSTQGTRRPMLDSFREFKTPLGGRRYGENHLPTLREKSIRAVLEGKTANSQKNWLKAWRGFAAFAISQGNLTVDPSAGIKSLKAAKSGGHMTWKEPQIAQYREHYALGTVARLAIELLLNIAARRHDAHVIGQQHVRNGKLSWRPHKTLNTTNKLLTIRIIPELQAALDAVPKSEGVLAFMVNEYGKAFPSASAFGNKFARWCDAAGLKPVLCDDGRTRNYRAHGLRKAALRILAHSGATGTEMMNVSGHSSLDQLQEYLDEVDQERAADAAMTKMVKASDEAKAGDAHGEQNASMTVANGFQNAG